MNRGKTTTGSDDEPSPGAQKNLQYDRETIAVMERCLQHHSLCIDGGAHRGDLLKEMFRIAPGGRHYAFEPLPRLARQLRRDFPDARVRQQALGKAADRAEFLHVENDPGYSGLKAREYDRPDPVIRTLSVDVVRLDDVIPREDQPAFIKLDLEGGEYDALLGAQGVIDRARPLIVFEAGARSTGRYGVSPSQLFELFDTKLDYRLTTMERWLAGQRAFDQDEFLAIYDAEFFYLGEPRGQ
ncbi:MAG: FkbM family methyltransferase [Pseudomonadota bacterium]